MLSVRAVKVKVSMFREGQPSVFHSESSRARALRQMRVDERAYILFASVKAAMR